MPTAPDPCVIVIFGASGDLTERKLIPALYEMHCAGHLPKQTSMIGISRSKFSDDQWREALEPSVRQFANEFDESSWREFAQRIFYYSGDATDVGMYKELDERIDALSHHFHSPRNVLFYLAVKPSLYEPIIECVEQSNMITEGRRWCSIDRDIMPWQRLIIEKPFGHDLESAMALNRTLGRVFEENAIYRIDHYLGKDLVQNLLVLRFANSIFEPLWNQHYIDHVQISALETVGVGERAGYYDESGAIRDMIQSHLLQVMALVAMEPPTSFEPHHIRGEKIKAIDAIKETPVDRLVQSAAIGQYAGDVKESAYHELKGVRNGTATETFAAVKFQFDNWRWAGTPFYLRTGKRLGAKRTEVVVQFKPAAADLFQKIQPEKNSTDRPANRLVIEVAPRPGVSLRFVGKVPGLRMKLQPAVMEFDYISWFGREPPEAYGPLLIDAMRGDQTLYPHRYEVEGSWKAVMPFIDERSAVLRKNMHANYQPGSWGPGAADELMQRSGRQWHNGEQVVGVCAEHAPVGV